MHNIFIEYVSISGFLITCFFDNIAPFTFTMDLDIIHKHFIFKRCPCSFVHTIRWAPRLSSHLLQYLTTSYSSMSSGWLDTWYYWLLLLIVCIDSMSYSARWLFWDCIEPIIHAKDSMERPSYKQGHFITHYIGKDPQALIKIECLLSNLPTCFCFQLFNEHLKRQWSSCTNNANYSLPYTDYILLKCFVSNIKRIRI